MAVAELSWPGDAGVVLGFAAAAGAADAVAVGAE